MHQSFVLLARALDFQFIVVLGLASYSRYKSPARSAVVAASLDSHVASVTAVARGRKHRSWQWQFLLECEMGICFLYTL